VQGLRLAPHPQGTPARSPPQCEQALAALRGPPSRRTTGTWHTPSAAWSIACSWPLLPDRPWPSIAWASPGA